MALDLDLRTGQLQDVERIQLAPASRGHGAGLHDQRGVARDAVTIGRVADMADVQVSGEKNIGARLGEARIAIEARPTRCSAPGALGQDRTDDA